MNIHSSQPDAAWSSRRVLVTGASGFVGRWLVQALVDHGATVHAQVWAETARNLPATLKPSLAGASVVSGDVRDLEFVSQLVSDAAIDTVYHLAAINTNTGTSLSPYAIFETNTRGTYTVLEACRRAPHSVRAIVASSKEVEDCFNPASHRKQHPYMTSKAAAELMARAYGDTAGLPVVIVRSDNLYGGGDLNWGRLVPGTVRSILEGRPPVIRSNGLFQRDYVYIEDAIAAYLAIGARLDDPLVAGKMFRIATGCQTSVLDMVKQVAHTAGRFDLEPQVLDQKSEERMNLFYTPEFEQAVLGWKSRYSLEAGLTRACEWYRDFFKKCGTPSRHTSE